MKAEDEDNEILKQRDSRFFPGVVEQDTEEQLEQNGGAVSIEVEGQPANNGAGSERQHARARKPTTT